MWSQGTLFRRSPALLLLLAVSDALFAAPPVSFDVPSVARAVPLDDSERPPADPDTRLYEIVIPVSTLVKTRRPLPAYQLWVFCQAPTVDWRVVDFAPRTELTSPYVGPLQVDRQRETSHRLGVNLTGRLESWGSAQAMSELAGKEKETKRVSEAPPMMLLQASGTIDRGSGVYFKFRPSRQTTLEGTRDLRLVVEVPLAWRASLLRLRCLAEPLDPERRSFGQAQFVVAVYRAGDSEAVRAAARFARADREFRRAWKLATPTAGQAATVTPLDWLPAILGGKPEKPPASCDHVVESLLFAERSQRGQRWLEQLPPRVQQVARKLVESVGELESL